MSESEIRMLARVLACNANALGMQAANMERAHRGEEMAYTDMDFFAEATQMQRAAGLLP
jgi:hypothetical protein